jgi:hypothetical protein
MYLADDIGWASSFHSDEEADSGRIVGYKCILCGTWEDYEVEPMPKPKIVKPKRCIEQIDAHGIVSANLETIKQLRVKGVSFRAIVDRLEFSMNHTTLQKHFGRIMDGMLLGKRGRKRATA